MRVMLLLTVAVWFLMSGASEAREPTADDYAVWACGLDQASPSWRTYIWHQTEPSSRYDRGFAEILKKRSPQDAPLIAAAEAASKQAQGSIRASGFPNAESVRILDDKLLLAVIGRRLNSTWLLSPRKLEHAGEVVRFSWPYYTEDRSQAYFFSSSCRLFKTGAVRFIRVQKRDGHWNATLLEPKFIGEYAEGELDDRAEF